MPVRLKRRILLPAAFVWLGWLALGQTEALARQYCVTCHLFPEPSLLDKKTWISQVMPRMAIRMGLSPESVNQHPEADALWKSGRFMRVPLITQANQVHRGGTTFEESLFLPLNGAFRARLPATTTRMATPTSTSRWATTCTARTRPSSRRISS